MFKFQMSLTYTYWKPTGTQTFWLVLPQLPGGRKQDLKHQYKKKKYFPYNSFLTISKNRSPVYTQSWQSKWVPYSVQTKDVF